MSLDDVRGLAQPLRQSADLTPLLERVGDARYVLLGEASHGTHDYYAWRAEISRRLIAEKGFSFVAVEGDWPDCYALNRCVKHAEGAPDRPRQVLENFDRWPTWMWANTEVVTFAAWLSELNRGRDPASMVGFYGLDVYSLWESMRAILGYLSEHDPVHIEAALQAWRCFEPYREDPQEYAWATRVVPTSCEDAVVQLLSQLRRGAPGDAGNGDPEARFDAEQNAEVAAGAERYYRAMLRGGGEAWNVRDSHMTDTLDRLMTHHGPDAKAVVWEHNTHVGDARATDMVAAGMINVGQLVRERHGDQGVVIVGFGGYHGSVIASDAWGAPMERMTVPPAREGSVEALLHAAGLRRCLFVFPDGPDPDWPREVRDHRAIGVVYDPDHEHYGNYVPTVLGGRYDVFCFFDETRALHPLQLAPGPAGGEQETYLYG
ncbi:MAG: erythromycin esterase family protein [Actinomycetota bacterium]|nr:erythromycin esterase family protein [Actinomycetota bacterium]